MEEARKLYNKQGISNGALNFGELQGYTDGQPLTTSDLSNFKSASVYLSEIAENIRYSQTNSGLSKISDSALQAVSSLNNKNYDTAASVVPKNNIDVNFKLGSATATMSMQEVQESSLLALLQQLQESKAIAGY